jgi:Skp family chaperone for outer membrane proteins
MKTFLPSKHFWAVVCAASATALVCAITGLAQDLKVGFVDLQKFATKSVKAQEMQKKLTDLLSNMPMANERKELATLEEQFLKQDPMLRETRFQLAEEIRIKAIEIKKLAEEMSRHRALDRDVPDAGRFLQDDYIESALVRWYELNNRGNVNYQPDLVKIIDRIRRQKGLSIVFNQPAFLSAEGSLDITDEVAEAYDAEPDPDPKAPAAPPRPKGSAAAPVPKRSE